ncbi:putative disease resistance protein RGA3 isoform X2 [Ziziphus jujuba]|uniref:Disease resistance protein RGA3 isoform X2 n=1 Tax=Ziziphus jujuba TaxID=326968 RepID=A0ABM3I492_ZIZJJ|nr:putative disease resistance protein RGA3 isoform X2 [Ziziphus jujuba]
MAEAVVTVMLENLNSLIQKKFGLIWGVKKEMEKLSSILLTICAVLEDAEERQLRDRAIKNWLQKLKDVADELDDILDECSMEASLLEYKRQSSISTQKVRASFFSCFNPKNTLFRFRIAKQMKDVSDRLDEIANERMKFHLREVVQERHLQVRDKRQTGSIVNEKHVYGRDEDKDKIVEFLVDNSRSSKDLSVYPIVGMGGMGKTTLAQLVFNDERVSRSFDIKIWVCVSEDFDVKRLIKAIIESASENACDALDMDPLQKRLQKMLERKKFLIVLDDVWNEDQEQWEGLRNVVACGLNGSSIVVTTRLKKVALIMGTVPMHQLSVLSEDDCWLLFKQRAFGNESEERPNLVKIGKEIVKKCKGNPLAAKTLGSLMRFKSEENEWLFVMESELWNLPQEETSILPALRLSYFYRPTELRRCFAYCAIFPKDFEIEKEQLIHLWMANDLISVKGNMEVEEIGNEICKELYWRSFFEGVQSNNDGFDNIYRFKMHDLVHDLAQCIMKDQARVVEIDCPVNLSRARHVIFNYSDQSFDMLFAFHNVESLRTLMLTRHCPFRIEARKFPCRLYFPSLRAFDAKNSMLTSISFLTNTSKHLRYLNISHTYIRILPKSICFLQSLQTLDVSCCLNLQKLPKQMSRLRSLRHLHIFGCSLLRHMPPNIGKLTCLRTLSIFIVAGRRGNDVDELGNLNLHGSLSIKNLEEVKSPMEAKKANLAGKMNLKCLELSWDRNEKSQVIIEQVLESLEPPPSIKFLDISNFGGRHFPQWFKNSAIYENLVNIGFTGCKNCMELPTGLGKLPSLTSLRLSGMDLVRYVDNEYYGGELEGGFLHLQRLLITDSPNLERLSKEERRTDFSCLSSLHIEKCPKLTLPCLRSIKELTIWGCSEALLRTVSNLHTLTSLEICDNDDLASFPDGFPQKLTTLQSLTIKRFSKLQDLQSDMLIGLSSLESLTITSCHMLECFPVEIFRGSYSLKSIYVEDCIKFKSLSTSFGDLTALEFLELRGCPELEAFPNGLNNLSCLKSLMLSGYSTYRDDGSQNLSVPHPKLTTLPEALQHLPSLQHMSIWGFPNLELLPDWLGNLTSLHLFDISNCPKLECLPTTIQDLTNLHTLEIRSCPKLAERCEKEIGEDWHKIAHVPRVAVWDLSHQRPIQEETMNCCFKLRLNYWRSLEKRPIYGPSHHSQNIHAHRLTNCFTSKETVNKTPGDAASAF